MTLAEILLWNELKNKQLEEVKHNLEGVIDAIADWIQTQRPSHAEHLGDDTQELSVPSHAQGLRLGEGS